MLQPRVGSAHAAVVRYSLLPIGILATLVFTLQLLKIPIGQLIRICSGALGGVLDRTVTEIGITYVHLDTGEGVLALPNAQVLAAAVGPLPAEIPGRPGWPAVPAEIRGRPGWPA
jgi:lipoprotein signal peptidase